MEKNGGSSSAKEIKKSVRITDKCEYIPQYCDSPFKEIKKPVELIEISDSDPSDPSDPSSSNYLSSPNQIQETPDYIRRSNERNIITPIELFSDEISPENSATVLTINSGEQEKDGFYDGGDVVRACIDAGIESLYCSARVGDFSYRFDQLEEGDYEVDLHFAEIMFTEGPPGMRVFDVFIQEKKVASGLDVYGNVGGNKPFVLQNLRASVKGKKGFSIRFEGLVGKPIVCGISVRRACRSSLGIKDVVPKLGEDNCVGCQRIKKEYEMVLREQEKIIKIMDNLKDDNEAKSKKCHEALTSLHELKMELMRKSMHVGSLAFAVEGQVKEKSHWFQCLDGMSEKLEMLKLEHNELLKNAKENKKCLETDFLQLSTALTRTVDHCLKIEKEHEDVKRKFLQETKERKDLYNSLIELKGNIRVFCRCRPMNAQEVEAGDTMVVDFESAKDGEIAVKGHVSSKKVFKFDSVFAPEESQEQVFEKTAPLATSVLDGYNVCIFAYGQTGTGKTFTMEGTQDERGVNYRTVEELFRIIREREGLYHYELTVSVLEVYNEQIRDLLRSGQLLPSGAASKRLEIKQQSGVHHVPGLVEAPVSNLGEAWGVLQAGSKARVVGSTNANEHSSRSHCMHCVMVRGENLVSGERTMSKLWLIDLAGSERVAKTDAQGERLKEAQNINKSLSALGDVISALATKSPHIPFRNSKLTHLLQDSLSGDSKTLMFVQISPNENDAGETLCSLNFASRVRGVELGPAKKQVDVSELSRYKFMVGKAKQDNKNKDEHIKCMEETIQSLEMKNRSKDVLNRNLQDKIKELESQLVVERKLARQHVDTRIAENNLQQHTLHKIIDEPNKEQEEEQNSSPVIERVRHRLSLKPLTEIDTRLLNITTPTTTTKQNDAIFRELLFLKEKENKPEPQPAVKRLSLCPSAKRVPLNKPQFRRNSLATIPSVNVLAQRRPSLIPSSSNMCAGGGSNKKVSSILRRSLQKKVIIRPPIWQQVGKKGVNGLTGGGVERSRMSIGCARRVLTNNGNGGGGPSRVTSGRQVQLQRRDVEKGWNQRFGLKKL